MGRLAMQTKFRLGNLKGKDSLGDIGLYEMTALKLILNWVLYPLFAQSRV
jgi:hypothetical protein